MAYQYDVFISYRRTSLCTEWTHDTFLPQFEERLREEVGKTDLKIFIDKNSIEGGDDWANRLRQGLAVSRVLAPIFLSTYFQSDWCTRELAIMHHRQTQLGFMTKQNPSSLIVPFVVQDGDGFPDEAKRFESLPCHDYYRLKLEGSAQRYVDFQDKMCDWVKAVAKAHQAAPQWDPEWLTKPDWVENVSNQAFLKTQTHIAQPQIIID
jgi:hypothetical protein